MAELTEPQRRLLAYWGEIQSAVSGRASTATLWAAVRAAAQAEGVSLRGISGSDMSVLRGIAAAQRNAMETLTRAGPMAAIEPAHIAQEIGARDLGAQALAPAWVIRFEHDFLVDGTLVTEWRSSIKEGTLPATHDQLRRMAEQDAEQLADTYGTTHIGIGRIMITAT